MKNRQMCYLIVDDDLEIRKSLAGFFERYDINAYQAKDAEEARELIAQHSFDLITLDVLMPGESGIELTKWIKENYDIPVILLTSLDDSVDKIIGLEVGADDYLCKPFDPRELLSRAKAVLRRYTRSGTLAGNHRAFFDVRERILTVEGVTYGLNTKEFFFIEVMLDSNGEAISRELLYRRLFDRSWCPGDRAVDNLVMRLRQKIEPNPSAPKYIITLRHKGYLIPPGAITVRS